MSKSGPSDVSGFAAIGSASSSMKRIAWLDGWRGLAILFVLAGHFGSGYFPSLIVLGAFGVEFFFVLSGRLMAEILFVNRHPLPDFFRRRFARIYPALLAYVTAMALVAIAAYVALGEVIIPPWAHVAALTFTMNYAQVFGAGPPFLLLHTWSLAVEEHSYMILALLAVLVSRDAGRAKWLLAVVAALAILNGFRLYEAGVEDVREIYWRTDVRLAPVFLSAATFLFLEKATLPAGLARTLGILPLFFVPLCIALFFSPSMTLTYGLSPILLALALNFLKYSPSWLIQILSIKTLTLAGLLSYSIYLWQQFFYHLSFEMPPLLAAAAAIACGALSFYFIESPARKWINGLRIRRSDGPVEARQNPTAIPPT